MCICSHLQSLLKEHNRMKGDRERTEKGGQQCIKFYDYSIAMSLLLDTIHSPGKRAHERFNFSAAVAAQF